MKLRDFLNNFNDAGKTIIDLYFENITFKISVGYNHIEVDTKEWKELIDVFGDKEIEYWYVYVDNMKCPRITVKCR
jgi:ABC-type uncharacterized transport system permease subunit